MKKKHISGLILAAMITASLTACSGTTAATQTASAENTTTEAVKTESTSTEEATSKDETTQAATEEVKAATQVLMMATTTSTDDTGLLDYLQPLFLKDTGIDLKWTAVGTGDAIKKGMDGEVDVILVHSKAKEEEFVSGGFGAERFQVMYNDFVIVGPKGGTVKVTEDVGAVFTQIKNENLVFISRGDNSGTHNKETGVWGKLEIKDYESNENYISAGAGMGDTLTMANEKEGYCLTDRGTWLAKKDGFPNLEIVCEGDNNLLNQYGVIAVSPDKYPDVNNEAANTFIQWICSPEVQKIIGEFGVEQYGEPLFVPNAEQK